MIEQPPVPPPGVYPLSSPSSRTPRPSIRMALGGVVLATAAILTVLACLTTTSHWACTSDGPYLDCGPRVSIGPISYGAAGNLLDPYVLAVFAPPLWTAGILILRRYYGATYALAPIAGIVAIVIFAQGRYDWGWEHNCFAFLACVFIPTAVCVLIARGINRFVAARQDKAAAYRERNAVGQQPWWPTLPPAGWYPDPAGDPRQRRHWDGRQWTEQWQYRDGAQWTSPRS